MTVMNPKFDTYFLHILHGQFSGFHSLYIFLVNSFSPKVTIYQILGANNKILSLSWKIDFTFGILNFVLIRKL